MSDYWSLLATGPNQERKVSRELERLELVYLIFWRTVRRVVRGRHVQVSVPAWPGYIFVRVANAWDAILEIAGVVDFVRFGVEPARVSDEVVDGLLAYAPGGMLPNAPKTARFTFGQAVRVRAYGLYLGYGAIFQHNIDDSRVIVLQEWLGRLVPVVYREDDIEAETPRNKKGRRKRRHRRKRTAP